MDPITIITVCYNAEATIEQTICSVLGQSYRPIEYIIIDGKSTDNTNNIILRYKPEFIEKGFNFLHLSEQDKGIFDAMNKGIQLATGKWINFMNAGDFFNNNEVIKQVFCREIPVGVKAIYGDTIVSKKFGQFVNHALPPTQIVQHMPTCHQAFFIDAEEMKQHPFSNDYHLTADYHFVYNLYKRTSNQAFLQLPISIVCYEAEHGISSINKLTVKKECARIRNINNTWRWYFSYTHACVSLYTKALFNNVIPKNILMAVKRWNRKRLSNRHL